MWPYLIQFHISFHILHAFCIFLFVFSYDSAPLSASLLSDWSEVHRMTPADLESLQQELQLGSPMILSDTIPPDA